MFRGFLDLVEPQFSYLYNGDGIPPHRRVATEENSFTPAHSPVQFMHLTAFMN